MPEQLLLSSNNETEAPPKVINRTRKISLRDLLVLRSERQRAVADLVENTSFCTEVCVIDFMNFYIFYTYKS